MSSLGTSTAVLASAVTNTSTFTMSYPSGVTREMLQGTTGGSLALDDNERFPQAASGAGTVAFSFGASSITVTNNSGITFPAGSRITASFGKTDRNGSYNLSIGSGRDQAARGDDGGAGIQELTASGAVTAGRKIVELNHASVVIAATMVATAHPGLFTARNTSASGTAAHTVTLTGGTWDGTNTVATLNAPGEALTVRFDDYGRGQIIENTGAVGLS